MPVHSALHSPPQGYPLPGWRGAECEQGRLWNPVLCFTEPSACFTEPSCSNAEHPPPLHLQCFPSLQCWLQTLPDSANPGLAGIISFIFNHLKILQCVTIGNEQQELEALQPGNIPGWQMFLITSLWVRFQFLFLCPVLGLLPLACSLSPYPRTRLHAHTLIPMCISTPSHNSHTHLYMLMHTCAYTYSFTHMYMCTHDLTQQQLPRCSGPVRGMVGPSIKEVHIYLGAGGRERGLHCL